MPESEYEVELFRKQGFTRQTCSKCHTPFWSLGIHDTCGEAPCQEYDFIGASPFKKKLTYRAMREDFLSFLEQNGHTRVKRYPSGSGSTRRSPATRSRGGRGAATAAHASRSSSVAPSRRPWCS